MYTCAAFKSSKCIYVGDDIDDDTPALYGISGMGNSEFFTEEKPRKRKAMKIDRKDGSS